METRSGRQERPQGAGPPMHGARHSLDAQGQGLPACPSTLPVPPASRPAHRSPSGPPAPSSHSAAPHNYKMAQGTRVFVGGLDERTEKEALESEVRRHHARGRVTCPPPRLRAGTAAAVVEEDAKRRPSLRAPSRVAPAPLAAPSRRSAPRRRVAAAPCRRSVSPLRFTPCLFSELRESHPSRPHQVPS